MYIPAMTAPREVMVSRFLGLESFTGFSLTYPGLPSTSFLSSCAERVACICATRETSPAAQPSEMGRKTAASFHAHTTGTFPVFSSI